MKGIILALIQTSTGMVPYWHVTGPEDEIFREGDTVKSIHKYGQEEASTMTFAKKDVIWIMAPVRGSSMFGTPSHYTLVHVEQLPSMEVGLM